MKPVTFACNEMLIVAPEEVARQILDLTKWPDFHGYGPFRASRLLSSKSKRPTSWVHEFE